MTNPPPIVVPAIPEEERPGRWPGIQSVEVFILTLLLVVMLGQTIYLLAYTRTVRENQDALICQAQVTTELREAAVRERQAQRDLLKITTNPDMTPEERRATSTVAIQQYLNVLNQVDADRANVPRCPEPKPF